MKHSLFALLLSTRIKSDKNIQNKLVLQFELVCLWWTPCSFMWVGCEIICLGATSLFWNSYYQNIRFSNGVVFFPTSVSHESLRFSPSVPFVLRVRYTSSQEFNLKESSGSWWNIHFNNLLLHINWRKAASCVCF